MVNRFLEVMALALLVVLTISTAFQVMNYQMLADIQQELVAQRKADAAPAQPVTVLPPQYQLVPVQPTVVPPSPLATATQSPQPQPAAATTTTNEPPAPPAPKDPPVVVQTNTAGSEPQSEGKIIYRVPPRNVATADTAAKPKPTPPPVPETVEVKSPWELHRTKLTAIIESLYGGKYDQVVKDLTSDYAEFVDARALASLMDSEREKNGSLRGIVDGKLYAESATDKTFHVTVDTDKDKQVVLGIALNNNGKISMLQINMPKE